MSVFSIYWSLTRTCKIALMTFFFKARSTLVFFLIDGKEPMSLFEVIPMICIKFLEAFRNLTV